MVLRALLDDRSASLIASKCYVRNGLFVREVFSPAAEAWRDHCSQSKPAPLKGLPVNARVLSLPVLGGLMVLANQASAAVPAAVTTAMADVGADSIIVATVFLVAAIALAAFVFMRRGAR
jgi:Inovirus Coat protein B